MIKKVVLFDLPQDRIALKPFTFTRPIAEIRVGIVTIVEKWAYYFPGDYAYMRYVSPFHVQHLPTTSGDTWYINATICPDWVVAETIGRLKPNEALLSEHAEIIAFRLEKGNFKEGVLPALFNQEVTRITFCGEITQLKHKWDIFLFNAKEIAQDWKWCTKAVLSKTVLDPHTIVYNLQDIYIGEHLSIQAALLDATEGPIYIGNHVTIGAGAVLKGPLAICDHVHVHAHTMVHGGSTLGPYTRVGGEVYQSVIFGHVDKSHRGFMGNSVIGAWCTIAVGSDFTHTQLNTRTLAVWDFAKEALSAEANLTYCGTFMGDYSHVGMGLHLEGGSVIDVAAYLGSKLSYAKYLPSFMRMQESLITLDFETVLEQIERNMQIYKEKISPQTKDMLANLFKRTAMHRMKAML